MPKQPKPKPVGRPKLAKGEAKGQLVAVRFQPEDLKKIAAAAKSSKQTVSGWIRSTLNSALEA
jgi:predicted HicB family RNase H-like nuclease